MVRNFKRDLEAAKAAESIVLNTFSALAEDYTFQDVSNNVECYSLGDILATAPDGKQYYIEVKDDSRIADTGKILCEEEVYFYDDCYTTKGNMYNNSDYYCIVSKKDRLIYVCDFRKLQEIYKKLGEPKVIKHTEQESIVYLLELCFARSKGALIHKINY